MDRKGPLYELATKGGALAIGVATACLLGWIAMSLGLDEGTTFVGLLVGGTVGLIGGYIVLVVKLSSDRETDDVWPESAGADATRLFAGPAAAANAVVQASATLALAQGLPATDRGVEAAARALDLYTAILPALVLATAEVERRRPVYLALGTLLQKDFDDDEQWALLVKSPELPGRALELAMRLSACDDNALRSAGRAATASIRKRLG